MEKKTATVSGCFGQDGSYMMDLLASKGYNVIGLHNRFNWIYRRDMLDCINFIADDLTDQYLVDGLFANNKIDEFYHFAGQSSVSASWHDPASALGTNIISSSHVLEAIRKHSPKTKFFLASSSEVYKPNRYQKFNEETPTNPQSPYAISKLAAEQLVKVYRDKYNIYACYARLFSHTSPRQKDSFVAKKVIKEVLRVYYTDDWLSPNEVFSKGMDIKRDFLNAKDIVEAAYLMMQLFEPADFVIGSGNVYSLDELARKTYNLVSPNKWNGFLMDKDDNRDFTCADITKAEKVLKWHPKISFDHTIKEIVAQELAIQRCRNV